QFAHDLAAAFVIKCRNNHLDSHNLIAALPRMRRALDTAVTHAKLLPALRSWRNLQLSASVNRRNIYLRTQRCLRNRYGNRNLDIISHTCEHRVRPRPHNHEQVTRSAAVDPRIPLALQPDPLPIAGSRLDAKIHSLRPANRALAVAGAAIV